MSNWKQTYQKETRKVVSEAFAKYKTALSKIKLYKQNEGPKQNTTARMDKEIVQGGYGNTTFEAGVDDNVDYELYRDKIDELLRRLPSSYRDILLQSFFMGYDDLVIYMDMKLPRTTYYRWKGEAIKMFSDEILKQEIKI